MGFEQMPEDKVAHYQSLQRYVGWTEEDACRVRGAADLLRPGFTRLADDFYEAIRQEPNTYNLVTGGQDQMAKLKRTLLRWLDELVEGTSTMPTSLAAGK